MPSDPSPAAQPNIRERDDLWLAERVAVEIGRSTTALTSLRKRGRFSAPDGYAARSPWWHPASVHHWLEAQQVPPGAVIGLRAAARGLRIHATQLHTYRLPAPDGTHRGHNWWLPDTLHTWAQHAFNDDLLPLDGVRDLVGCNDDEWEHLHYDLPTPYLTHPNRWWPKPIHAWIQERGKMLRANPEVLLVRDIPADHRAAEHSVDRCSKCRVILSAHHIGTSVSRAARSSDRACAAQ